MDTLYKVRTYGTESRLYTIGDYRVSYDPYDNFLTHVLGKALEDVLTVDHDDYVGTCVAVSPDASKILVSGKDGSKALKGIRYRSIAVEQIHAADQEESPDHHKYRITLRIRKLKPVMELLICRLEFLGDHKYQPV